MGGKLILYYIALIFFTGWAVRLLVKASRDLCRDAERDYRDPNRSAHDAKRDKT